MGVACCKTGKGLPKEGALFGQGYNSGRGLPQMLILGPEGSGSVMTLNIDWDFISGKTTLTYSTVLPGWTGITTAMEPTVAFHYEEIQRNNIRFGMWDVRINFIAHS